MTSFARHVTPRILTFLSAKQSPINPNRAVSHDKRPSVEGAVSK